MIKVLVLTGSRGEWGYIRPFLKAAKNRKDIKTALCVTNMHMLPSYGLSLQEIKKDGFKVDYEIYMSYDGYNHTTSIKSLASILSSLADIVHNYKPDWILLAGDRGEQLMGALAGAFSYTPVAHIQAGELSGNIDGMTRHAIGKFAHLHFASNLDAATRLRNLGEEETRIKLVGAPQIDELVSTNLPTREQIEFELKKELPKEFFLVVQHPVTEQMDEAAHQIKITLAALKHFEVSKILILPNNDAGTQELISVIHEEKDSSIDIYSNLSRFTYLGLLNNCSVIIGNSSSGLLEAPTFKVPCVNIGRRQIGRIRGVNVIDCPFDESIIVDSIKQAISPTFKKDLEENCFNPYGDGNSTNQIIDCLLNTVINNDLVTKHLTF